MPTIREVSRAAGVSISTVSRVLNHSGPVSKHAQERVLAAVARLGYYPNAFARGLVTKRSGGIGATVTDLSDPFFGLMLKGIEERVEQGGMHLIVTDGHGQVHAERESVAFLTRHNADAIIAYLQQVPDAEVLDWARPDRPLVIVARYVPSMAARCLHIDNVLGGSIATRHLLAMGHRRIAHISGPLALVDGHDRLVGYRRTLEEAGLPVESELIVEADFSAEGGASAMQRLLDRGASFTALFAGNDQMAAGAMDVLRARGLMVPDDVSVVGFDDLPMDRYLYAPLTTVRQPVLEMGRAAADLALAALRGEEVEVSRVFEAELVVRHSVKRMTT